MGPLEPFCESGHQDKLLDGACRLCGVACREHYVDRLSVKTLQSDLLRGGRWICLSPEWNDEFFDSYPQCRNMCGIGGEFEASLCVVLPAQARVSIAVQLDQQYCNNSYFFQGYAHAYK